MKSFNAFATAFVLSLMSGTASFSQDIRIDIVTGGYEAEQARVNNTPLQGPRTSTVAKFMERAGLNYRIVMVPWSRGYNRTLSEPNTLIYPLTRTAERENQFDWIKAVDTHTYQLIGTKLLAKNLPSKEMLISGEFRAICEATTVNCSLLREFGFPEEAIIKVKGKHPGEFAALVVNGRAHMIMDNLEAMRKVTSSEIFEQITTIGGHNIVRVDYLAGAQTDPVLLKRLLSVPHSNLKN